MYSSHMTAYLHQESFRYKQINIIAKPENSTNSTDYTTQALTKQSVCDLQG